MTTLGGCNNEVEVKVIISGTPQFWKQQSAHLRGIRRVGIGLRAGYDPNSLRILDWQGSRLPRDLRNLGGNEREDDPDRSGRVTIARRKSGLSVLLHTATITNWGDHWTPLVLEFKAALTSHRSRGSCHLALPTLIGVGTPTLGDANAAASGNRSVIETSPLAASRGAVTFGRVIVRTNGRLLDGEARPSPDFVDGNPWLSDLGDAGEEAAVWTCEASTARRLWPHGARVNPRSEEVALDPSGTENDTCAGLAVIEARGSGTFRDAALLIVGGIFSLLLGTLLKQAYDGVTLVVRRKR